MRSVTNKRLSIVILSSALLLNIGVWLWWWHAAPRAAAGPTHATSATGRPGAASATLPPDAAFTAAQANVAAAIDRAMERLQRSKVESTSAQTASPNSGCSWPPGFRRSAVFYRKGLQMCLLQRLLPVLKKRHVCPGHAPAAAVNKDHRPGDRFFWPWIDIDSKRNRVFAIDLNLRAGRTVKELGLFSCGSASTGNGKENGEHARVQCHLEDTKHHFRLFGGHFPGVPFGNPDDFYLRLFDPGYSRTGCVYASL